VIRQLANTLSMNPVVERAHARYVHFRKLSGNRYAGIFESMAEAEAAIPQGRRVGYDHAVLAGFYRERMDRVFTEDYPVLYWLEKLLTKKTKVFDFGGHVGLHFYAYAPYLPHEEPDWKVCDVHAVVEEGRRLAREHAKPTLTFTEDGKDADGRALFLSAGALSYLEDGYLPRLLAGLQAPPKHLVLNKMPLHDVPTFVTLQDTGVSVHPYTVFERRAFVASVEALGYRLKDEWRTTDHHCHILFQPKQSVHAYTGLVFERQK
jgi:putative methyltransferase (TIGR04325 family)